LDKLFLFFNKHYESRFIMQNAPFDLDVLAKKLGSSFTYDLLDRCLVHDTAILYRLYHLATIGYVPFKYSLATLAQKFLNVELEKDNDVRLTFEQFRGVPISDIPMEWLEYGAKDAVATFDVYLALMSRIEGVDDYKTLLSHDIQLKGDLALFHIRKNGIGFDLKRRDVWLKDMNSKLEAESDVLASWGWVRGLKGLQERYEAIVTMLGIADKLPRTESNQISSKSEDLEAFRGLPFVDAYLSFHELEKATTFVRDLTESRVHPRYNLLVNTGRTSCSKPNVQQLPRVGGVREMFKAKEGHTLIITDYSSLELAILSQVNMTENGFSKMGELINEGKCLHYYTASQVYGKPESAITKEERQFAKIPNFAFPTNMGAATFVKYCAQYNVSMTENEAWKLKNGYAKAYPEISQHFWNVNRNEDTVYTLTGRRRKGCSYTAYLNTKFQGLAADGAKLALYELDKAGFTTVLFCHDEAVTEVPEDKVEELRKLQEKIMIEQMRVVCPDIKISVESTISPVYVK
jgi:DNA polymerase I-like protein with 3'-5' exonuclease and polymerase domains